MSELLGIAEKLAEYLRDKKTPLTSEQYFVFNEILCEMQLVALLEAKSTTTGA